MNKEGSCNGFECDLLFAWHRVSFGGGLLDDCSPIVDYFVAFETE
jgi:hypothetical protein